MIHVKFETGPFQRKLAKFIFFAKYVLLRPAISWSIYHFYYKYRVESKRTTTSGKPLKEGISYCLVAKDESEAIEYCLQSLIGFVDQLVSIDNGSSDDTLLKMLRFKEKLGHALDIIVLSRPEMNLMQCRQECLSYVDYNWIIRGDADFIFTNTYKNSKRKILNCKRPAGIAFQLITPFGDENHYNKCHALINTGEYFLRSFEKEIKYQEFYGRLEHASIPIYYKLIRNQAIGIVHITCNKSNERIFYRTCYLDYREYVNNLPEKQIDFDQYKKKWEFHVFNTVDAELLQYRMARLVGVMCHKFPSSEKASIELDLSEAFTSLYRIVYRVEHPFIRVKKEEDESAIESLINRLEDENWIPDPKAFYSDSIRKDFRLDD